MPLPDDTGEQRVAAGGSVVFLAEAGALIMGRKVALYFFASIKPDGPPFFRRLDRLTVLTFG